MTDKHTPIPWHAYDRGIGWEVHRSGPANNWCKTSPESCGDVIWDGFRETVSQADAEFIVRAVNSHALMLEALRQFLEVNGRFNDMLHDKLSDADIVAELDGKLDIAAAQAEAAIAAAEGGTDAG